MQGIAGRSVFVSAIAIALSAFFVGFARASDPPDAKANPVTGLNEITDSYWTGTNYGIRHTVALSQPVFLTDGEEDERGPRIDILSDGRSWVVWWRDASVRQVLVRIKDETGTWSEEQIVSGSSESAGHPAITHDDSKVWIVYEAAGGSSRSIKVGATDPDPDPFPTATQVATTTFEEPAPLVHAEVGHLWITWIDSETDLKWCEFDYETESWGSPQTMSYEESSVDDARKDIRAAVTLQ
jgi:hypothetical protein